MPRDIVADAQPQTYRISDFFGGINRAVNEQNLAPNESPNAHNFDNEDGNLSTVPKPTYAKLPTSYGAHFEVRGINPLPTAEGVTTIENLMFYRKPTAEGYDDGYIIAQSNFIPGNENGKAKLYYMHLTSASQTNWTFLSNSNHNRNAYVNYQYRGDPLFITSSPTEKVKYWEGPGTELVVSGANTLDNPPLLGYLAVYQERVFGSLYLLNRYRVFFSDDGYSEDEDGVLLEKTGPLNWRVATDEGGIIDIMDEDGGTSKLIPAFNGLYVFKRYGIFRIAGSYPGEFNTDSVYTSGVGIEGRTVVHCAEAILFRGYDGIYAFNGMSAVKISQKIQHLFDWSINGNTSVATFFKGKYILSMAVQYPGEATPARGNTVIEYDVDKKTFTVIKGLVIHCFLPVRHHYFERLLYGSDGPRVWEYPQREV